MEFEQLTNNNRDNQNEIIYNNVNENDINN
jgi:hypothetical protein